jgi:TrmH family RNA methyltransferase
MTVPITSTSNDRVKELVKLRESPRRREQMQLFVIEGFNEVRCSIEFGKNVETVFYCKQFIETSGLVLELKKLKADKINFVELGSDAFKKASYRNSSDGFLATVKMWDISLTNLFKPIGNVCVILDEIEKPGNLGAIIRTVEAMGVKTLLLSDSCVDFFNPNVIRSSRGLFAGINVRAGSKEQIFKLLSQEKFSLVGTSGKAKQSFWDYEFDNKNAFVFGSEKDGLGKFWLDRVHGTIKIPMSGKADSLNLNVSVACVLTENERRSAISERP